MLSSNQFLAPQDTWMQHMTLIRRRFLQLAGATSTAPKLGRPRVLYSHGCTVEAMSWSALAFGIEAVIGRLCNSIVRRTEIWWEYNNIYEEISLLPGIILRDLGIFHIESYSWSEAQCRVALRHPRADAEPRF
jgi:hypothetical protein